jgi:hypothetical protein
LEGLQAEVQFYCINDMQAATLGLRGSPSVLIDGKVIQPADVAGFSLRLFKDEAGKLLNIPSVETLRKLIREKKEE